VGTKAQTPAAKRAAPASLAPARIQQTFSVPFAYDVTFTRDALVPDNGALLEAFTRGSSDRRHRVLPIVDAGLAAAWPELSGWLTAYFTRHADRLELVALPAPVVGGEAEKDDPRVVDRLLALFHEHHMDRHSFVLVLGAGAVQVHAMDGALVEGAVAWMRGAAATP